MALITPRAGRLLKAITSYQENFKTWDTLNVFNKIQIKEAGNGILKGSFNVTEDVTNVANSLHGGFTSSLIDVFSIYGYAQHSRGQLAWTTDMYIQYLNPGQVGDEINVEVRPYKLTSTRAVMECLLFNETSGKPVAKGTVGLSVPHVHPLYLETLPFDSRLKDE